MSREIDTEIAVVGAGPGGSTLAALLAARGLEVVLLDRDEFPRDKVCGEFLSWDAIPILELIGALGEIDAAGAATIGRCSIVLSDRELEFELPLPARGISRARLDSLLIRRARELGVRVFERCAASRVEPRGRAGGFVLARDEQGHDMRVNARVLVGSWGRWGRLDVQLQRRFTRQRRKRHFGFKRHYESLPADDGMIRLYSFDRGYLGVSPVETGRTNVCGLVHDSRLRGLRSGWPSLVETIRTEGPHLDDLFRERRPAQDDFVSSEPVIFTAREPAVDGMLLIGDAAGLIDPLAGNGMAMAMQSALLAAGSILQSLSGGSLGEMSETLYHRTHARWFDGRIRWSRASAAILSRPTLLDTIARIAPIEITGRFLTRRTRANLDDVRRLVDAWSR